MNYFKLKFLLLFFALAVAIPPAWAGEVTDVLTLSTFGVSGTDYTDVSGNKATSDAVYAGNLAGGYNAIQLRTDKSTSGIITTKSGGKVKSIKITFNSNTAAGRSVIVYGKSYAYTAASELYNTNARGDAIGSLNIDDKEAIDAGNTGTITIPEGEEYSYIGIKSNKNAIYLDKIEIVWETEDGGETPVKQDLTTFAFSPATATATMGEAFTAPTLTVNPTVDVTYSSSDPDVATVANNGDVTLVGAGTTTITASFAGNDEYNAATASYTLKVNAAQPTGLITDFYESFNNCDGKGGNDGSWSGSIASNNITTDNQGWTFENEGGADKCIKLGTTKNGGSAVTPNITVIPGITYTLTFKAGAWDGSSESTTLNISATGGTLSAYSVTLEKAKWNDYTITLTPTENTVTITFSETGGNHRFFLDEVRLTHDQNATPVTVVAKPEFSPAGGTYTEPQTVTITCATEDATIYYTTDGSEPTASSTEYTSAITISETTTLKAIAVKDGMNDSQVATATYTISEPAAPLANEFVLVTDINQLAHGKQIIFVSTNTKNDYADAMSSQQKSNNRGVETVAVTENKTVTLNDNGISPYSTEIFTLEKDGDYWYFKANKTSGYIYAAGGTSNNYLKTSESKIDNAQATISIDGKAIVTFNVSGTGARNLLSYNPNNSPAVYSCYKAEQKPVYIYVEKGDTPEPEPLAVTLPEVPAEHYKVGQEVKVKATVENGSENTLLTYKVGEETLTPDNEGNVTLPNKKAGDVVVTVKATDGDRTANDSKTYVFDAAEALTITLNPANGEYYVGAEAKVNVTVDKAITTNPTITYKFGEEGEAQTYNAENGIVLPTAEAGTINLTVTVDDNGYEHTGANTATGTYTVKNKPLTITLDPASGEYTVGKEAKVKVTIENVVGESDVEYVASYTVNEEVKTQKLTANEGYVTLPNDKAVTYTLTVTALDERMEEVTATGTYKFNAAPAFDITLTPNKEGNYTVGENAVVTVAVDKYIDEDYLVTYTIGDSEEQIEYNAKTGIVLPNDKAGDVTVKVYVTDGYDHEGEGTATATYHFDAAPAIVVTLDPAEGSYTVGTEVKVNVKIENTIGEYLATYTINDGDEQEFDGNDIVIPSDQIATVTLAVSVTDAYHDGVTTVTGQYVFSPMPVVAMPTFSLVAGSYGKAQQLIISAESGATILYSTDGSEPTTKYTNAIDLGQGTTTVKAVATKDGFAKSPVVTATYIIDIPKELPTITPFKGYYQIKNNGNGMYANIAGRKTLNFTDAPADKAGTVIWLETNDKGQVQSIRSQAADLQGYANRAMHYVPKMVDIVVNKINQMEGIEDATGAGSVLGENGLKEIMAKFNECFDYHLYVEQAGEGGWRLYGKTPNMQHVVDFYRDHKDQVEAKLPKLEDFINDALDKLKAKIGGDSVFTEFKLLDIWQKMGGTLTKPTDDASTMAFYREVLNNKNYVWDFAYQTAQIYWGNVKKHPRYKELKAELGEYADYIDEFVTQVRPDFKYYVIQRGNEPDYISEGNGEIINGDPRTIWTLEPRTDFTVNIAGEQFGYGLGGYATTNYTDFAYTVREGVTAYTVTGVENGVAKLEALSGVIPAQTPVLLIAKEAGDYVLTLSTEAGTAPADNLLVGPDYLIKTYELKTPMVEQLFVLAKGVLGEQLYNQYVAEYEYLQLLYAGTVNNKYFWGLSQKNVEKCVYINEENTQDCVIRNLVNGEFVNDWKSPDTNKAFLVSETDQTIKLPSLRGDINKDGVISITDVTALIDILLDWPDTHYQEPTDTYPKGLDYEAADVNEEKEGIEITDVTTLIDILLNMPDQPAQGSGN